MKHIALQLEFETDKFRLTGPIPEDSNAGNQFYGEDFAKWLCKSLPQWHLDYLDEDWGWYVFSIRGETPNDETNEICVYAYPEEGGRQLNDNGQWMLIVHTRFKVRWMHFFKRWNGGAFNRTLGAELLRALQALGTRNIKATEMLLDSAGNMRPLKEFAPDS